MVKEHKESYKYAVVRSCTETESSGTWDWIAIIIFYYFLFFFVLKKEEAKLNPNKYEEIILFTVKPN